jgi:Uma2 family endonuclease
MATVGSHLSLEEFHRLYDGEKPYREYWFGEAVPKPMATAIHGAIQCVLMMLLLRRGWKTASEVRLKIVPYAQPVPDIIVSRAKFEQPYPTKPMEICVEILSPEDRLKKAIQKAGYYLDWGVQYYWIIDPGTRTALIVTAEHRDGIWIHPDGALTAGDDTEIPLSEIFDEADKLVD